MRKYLHIDLNSQSVREEIMEGETVVRAGRYFIAKALLALNAAPADPLSRDNPLIFITGPFAGTNFSNANRTSVGCKSPLTGGVKEANAGGSFGLALGQLHLAGITLYDAADDWVVIHIKKDGDINFDPAGDYLGKNNFEVARLLHDKYGKKVSLALCGPVGEYQGLLSGIAFSDTDRRPSRFAARGGVGAVMGSKKVKAVVVEMHKMPELHDRKMVIKAIREYADKLQNDDIIANFRDIGTAMMADTQNYMGGLPVRNFSEGRLVDTSDEPLKMGGDFIRHQNIKRGGQNSHACMPGCVIQCSNVYADADGNEMVSPVEYETLGLLGTNCGITEPDELARLNFIVNDLGLDSIETGAMLALLMEAGQGEFGDVDFMIRMLEEIRQGTGQGRLLAQGTARVGAHYQVGRIPVIKKQAISAYDPRVVEVTGISMMVSAQGADHTTGNVPYMVCDDKEINELVEASMESQITNAATDSLGLCVFGRSVTVPNIDFIITAINDAHGTQLEPSFFQQLGRDTLRMENEFNRAAGFTVADDELPEFFYHEALAPTNNVARFHGPEVQKLINDWLQTDN